jgi:hypothetical protein
MGKENKSEMEKEREKNKAVGIINLKRDFKI